MSADSPASILFNVNSVELAISGGIGLPLSQSGFIMVGVNPTNTASFLKVDSSGRLLVNVKPQSNSTAVLTGSNQTTSSFVVLPANTNRREAMIFNDSSGFLYLAFSGSATTSSFSVKISADSLYTVDGYYTGIISGIWSSTGSGQVRTTEITE